jgi:hypothetical protein
VTVDEEWRVIPEFPAYEASSLGRVRRGLPGQKQARVGYILQPTPRKKYLLVSLMRGGVINQRRVNRIVCATFQGPPPTPHHEAAHGDGDCQNNRATNLRWATPKENTGDKYGHGTIMFGSRNPAARMTERSVVEAISLRSDGVPTRVLADRFGVSLATMKRVVRRISWAQVLVPIHAS